MKKLFLSGIAVLFLSTGTAHAEKPLTPKQTRTYKELRSIGLTKKDAAQVARDPGVKKGEWGWYCEGGESFPMRMKAVDTKVASTLVKYRKNAVCE
jgi:hypothetical protein